VSTNGSILLCTREGIWDCIECHESRAVHYTESGWQHRYKGMYGLDDIEMAQVEDENCDLKRYQYIDLRKREERGVNANKTTLMLATERLEVMYADWDKVEAILELQVAAGVEGNKRTIGHTEYTSLLLRFEPVMFQAAAGIFC
jgi:hypothetical protein